MPCKRPKQWLHKATALLREWWLPAATVLCIVDGKEMISWGDPQSVALDVIWNVHPDTGEIGYGLGCLLHLGRRLSEASCDDRALASVPGPDVPAAPALSQRSGRGTRARRREPPSEVFTALLSTKSWGPDAGLSASRLFVSCEDAHRTPDHLETGLLLGLWRKETLFPHKGRSEMRP